MFKFLCSLGGTLGEGLILFLGDRRERLSPFFHLFLPRANSIFSGRKKEEEMYLLEADTFFATD